VISAGGSPRLPFGRVIQPLPDTAPGTLGFRLSGRLRREDYTDVLIPPIRQAAERGDRIRLLVHIDPDFDGLEAGALWEDLKAAVQLGVGHRGAWERFAIVSDADWIRRATALFGWLTPGELRVFGADELEAAKAWLSA